MSDLSQLESRLAELIRARIEIDGEGDSADGDSSDRSTSPVDPLVAEVMAHVRSLADARRKSKPIAAFLGPKYSYSYLAAVQYFGEGASLLPVSTIAAVFEAVVAGDCRQGIVPIENSTDGRVVDTISRLIDGKCSIIGEVRLPIHHCLLAKSSRTEIVEIQSKPQAISQCRGYLSRHFPLAKLTSVASTAAAAHAAATQPGIAAIASAQAGRHHGLNVVANQIEDNPDNVTRFVVLGSEPAQRSGDDKTTLVFEVKHQPGSLADAMLVFKALDLNLTFIESFPIPGETDEYSFVVELQGHRDDVSVQQALERLNPITDHLVVLGSYPKA